MTAGCAPSLATRPPAVALPADCDPAPVSYPPLVKDEDLGVRAWRYGAALGQANTRIERSNDCNAAVRAVYQGRAP